MKKQIVTLLCSVLAFAMAYGQISTPAASPRGEMKQTVGLTDITISYSRPGVKGRTIYAEDGLVPFGQIWRTGANQSTTIEFSEDVLIMDKPLAKGKYALYTIPNATSWDVMFYSDLTLGGNTANYDTEKEVLRVSVKPHTMPMTLETLVIGINDITDNSATLTIVWENTVVAVPITVHTHEQVEKQIAGFAQSPMAQVASNYLNAGYYYYQRGENLETAAKYMKKGVEHTTSAFKYLWMHRASEAMAAAGDVDGALKMAKAAHENGQNAPDDARSFYESTIKGQIDENIKKWSMR